VPSAGWQLRMTVSADGTSDTVVATLPGDPTETFEVNARYGVQETVPTGWRTVACDTVAVSPLDLTGVVQTDTSTIQAARTPEAGGSFAATTSGVHLVLQPAGAGHAADDTADRATADDAADHAADDATDDATDRSTVRGAAGRGPARDHRARTGA
jgi:hypothetical protein